MDAFAGALGPVAPIVALRAACRGRCLPACWRRLGGGGEQCYASRLLFAPRLCSGSNGPRHGLPLLDQDLPCSPISKPGLSSAAGAVCRPSGEPLRPVCLPRPPSPTQVVPRRLPVGSTRPIGSSISSLAAGVGPCVESPQTVGVDPARPVERNLPSRQPSEHAVLPYWALEARQGRLLH